ncbi:hypothetical protein KP509_33G033800 [Ceratopteris richardii]|uniref:Cytochrome P450 n=1 Tax=Ceratopteris richardii TaxID=49495 RepID=A0A8T2QN09_CERRI|nr:hypothetical protein KP509_33G033800 [Ceratopteris richardii]
MGLQTIVSFPTPPTASTEHGTQLFHLLSYTSATWSSYEKLFMLAACLLLMVMALWMVVELMAWGHPGGSAWGLYSFLYCSQNTKRTDAARSPPPIPGPRGLPFLGSLLTFAGENGKCAHRRLAALASTFGARSLMAFSLGATRVVVSSDPRVARQILCNPSFNERPLTTSARKLLFDRSIGFAPSGGHWCNLRRICAAHLFSPRRIAGHEAIRQLDCTAMLDAIAKNTTRSGTVEVKLRPYLQHAALNNIMATVFGKRFDYSLVNGDVSGEAAELQSMVREGFELLGAFNMADHLPPAFEAIDSLRIRQRCDALVPKVFTYVHSIIEQHRAHRHAASTASSYTLRASELASNGDSSDFVDVLLALEGEEKLCEADMISVLWEMIFRGTDTIAILIEWILAELVLNPDIQARLHEEIVATVGKEGHVRDVDAIRMPYLQAVIKEGQRMHPPGPLLSWARLAVHDTEVDGHLVPAGTTAMVNMWAITHDNNIWEEVDRFNPERFVSAPNGEESRTKAMDGNGSELRLAPFGAGARVCPGKALALATVSLWVARMVQRFAMAEHPLQPVRLSEVLKLSCEMEFPLVASLTPRF